MSPQTRSNPLKHGLPSYWGQSGRYGLYRVRLEQVCDEHPNRIMETFSAIPPPKMSDTVVEPCNAVSSIHQPVENAEGCFLLGDGFRTLKLTTPTSGDLNRLVSAATTSLTMCLCFPGQRNSDLRITCRREPHPSPAVACLHGELRPAHVPWLPAVHPRHGDGPRGRGEGEGARGRRLHFVEAAAGPARSQCVARGVAVVDSTAALIFVRNKKTRPLKHAQQMLTHCPRCAHRASRTNVQKILGEFPCASASSGASLAWRRPPTAWSRCGRKRSCSKTPRRNSSRW